MEPMCFGVALEPADGTCTLLAFVNASSEVPAEQSALRMDQRGRNVHCGVEFTLAGFCRMFTDRVFKKYCRGGSRCGGCFSGCNAFWEPHCVPACLPFYSLSHVRQHLLTSFSEHSRTPRGGPLCWSASPRSCATWTCSRTSSTKS